MIRTSTLSNFFNIPPRVRRAYRLPARARLAKRLSVARAGEEHRLSFFGT
jgi:hypothetical protein